MAKIVNRVLPILNSERKSRADLYALLDACLDLAPYAGVPRGEAQIAACEIGTALAAAAFSWTEPGRPMLAHDWGALRKDPATWRQEIILRLVQAPTVLPWELVKDLLTAIAELDKGDGAAPALLRPTPKADRGRGRNPKDARECEEMLLCWIAWQRGKGRKAGELANEVAEAVHKTPKTVEAWRKDWKSRAGEQEVERELEDWSRRGEQGEDFSLLPISLADMAGLWLKARDPRDDPEKA